MEPDSRRSESCGLRCSPVLRFDGAAELGYGDHRDAEFFGNSFQSAGNLRNFLGAVFVALGGSGHQLQIIHDDQIQAVFQAEAAGFGAQFGDCDAGGIVDEDLRLRQIAGSAAQPVPVFFVQISGVDPVGVDPGFAAQKTFYQLLLAHFEAENADGLVILVSRHARRY